MPDWTYHPLRRPMGILLGERRSLRLALGVVSQLVRIPGGRAIVAGLGHTSPPASARRNVAGMELVAPVGASVGLAAAAEAVRALPPLGAAIVEVGPVPLREVERIRANLRWAGGPVAIRVAGTDAATVASALAEHATVVVVDVDSATSPNLSRIQESMDKPILAAGRPEDLGSVPADVGVVIREGRPADVLRLSARHPTVLVTTSDPTMEGSADLIAAGAQTVLATQAALIESGPGWFQRATGRILTGEGPTISSTRTPWVAWLAGVGLGLGMIAGGVGATVVALGPVLLPYDVGFLGRDAIALHRLNPQLIPFLQHDRVTLAGTMVALGILYASLSWWGIRDGHRWARDAVLASGVLGFPTLFYFFAYHYVEPAHVALALVLFPLFLVAVWRRPPARIHKLDGDERPAERQRALYGQLVMILIGVGLIVGGADISLIGMTTVYVPSDLGYMSTSAHDLAAANDRLLGFVAHDRAGFGGALISTGAAIILLAAWGWHRGQAWVWWCLASAAIAGFGATIAIHVWVGYTDFLHLAPVYTGTILSALSLGLSYKYLLDRRPAARRSAAYSAFGAGGSAASAGGGTGAGPDFGTTSTR